VTSKDKLFDLINAANPLPRPLTPNNVEIVNPRLAVGTGYNTRATVRALPDKGYTREQDVFYKRIDLAALAPIQYRIEEVGSPAQLLAMLNTRRGTWLELTDVLAFTIPTVAQGSFSTLTLTAADESYGFVGSVQVRLTRDAVIPVASVLAGEPSADPQDATKTLFPFTISLSGATSNTVSVGIRTVDGTAGGDVDYDAILELVQFLPGEVSKLVTVRAHRNTGLNPKTFSVLLSDPSHCTIGTGTANASIPSNPVAPSRISIADGVSTENDPTNVLFSLTLEREADGDVQVNFATRDDSAVAGVDYTSASGTTSFDVHGTTQGLNVTVVPRPAGSPPKQFFMDLTDPTSNAVIQRGVAVGNIPEAQESGLPVISVADATFTPIPQSPPVTIQLDSVHVNTVQGPEIVFNGDGAFWEERPGVQLLSTLSRGLLDGEALVMQRKRYNEDSFATVSSDMHLTGTSVVATDLDFNTHGPSYDLEANGTLFYRMAIFVNGTLTQTSDPFIFAVYAEDPNTREIFRDEFTGTGALHGHAPDINVPGTEGTWLPGDGVTQSAWFASDTPPVATLTAGRLLMGSPNDGPIILNPGTNTGSGEDNPPVAQAYQNSTTTTFRWRSPRTSAQDALLTDNGYPMQLSVGKSEVTLGDGFRTTIGFTITGNDGTAKQLTLYGGTPVPVTYEADTDYNGTLVVEPGKRTLDFLGVHLELTVPDETKHHLVVGPYYLHMGENCQLDYIRTVTGRHYFADQPAPLTWTETFDVPQDQPLNGRTTSGSTWAFFDTNGQGTHVGNTGSDGTVRPGPDATLYASDIVWLPQAMGRDFLSVRARAQVLPNATASVELVLRQRDAGTTGEGDIVATMFRENTTWIATASSAVNRNPVDGSSNVLAWVRADLDFVDGNSTAHVKFYDDLGTLLSEGDFNLYSVALYRKDREIGLSIRSSASGNNLWENLSVSLHN